MHLPRRLSAVAFAVTVLAIPARSQGPENETAVLPVEEEQAADANGQSGTRQICEVRYGYGFRPSTGLVSDDIPYGFLRDSHRVTGPFNLDLSFRVRPWLDLGAVLSYTRIENRFHRDGQSGRVGLTENYYSCLSLARFGWLRHKRIRLYSGFGVGYCYQVIRVQEEPSATCETQYNRDVSLHLTVLGFSVGGRLHVFAEGGYGILGTFRAGAGYTF